MELESLPPYLIAWRPLESGPSRASRPVVEVFDATSFRTLWRSDPDQPEAVWEPTDHCEPSLPDTHDSPIPLTSTDVVDAPCGTGISPRAATGADDVVFSLRRGAVSNACFVYHIAILADGRVHYEGSCMDGVADLQLPEGRLDELIDEFNENRFFDLCDATRHVGFDGGRMVLEFWNGTHVKGVEADLLHWDETAALREFGDIIDDAIAIERFLPAPRRRL